MYAMQIVSQLTIGTRLYVLGLGSNKKTIPLARLGKSDLCQEE